ncbi:HpcH/HpaI aldolase/citrate lyase family protein [Arthrobacter sp. TES]|jgi:4-hydroxy-2-oxoheptanedioate aldolase|uniref:HpcH/HpaI aldolase family protein n=1 Tax=Paenarthrobacter TaxID=1742992 RepID=UPI00041891A2|nr:HpcH/HpaI aldolase/citrate lyase family protein [Paenarthrobacter ureafaciens]AOY73093.1 alpha-dehydro-beta-deoxy-D-glucarate aldolase [Arthrobacter sp. ZXY-2]KUR64061.1 alpha-dehydro-beta-deoxy-D-glucarate aldolase [Arthrobacter sp. ATCC 21022]QOI64667.1 HpcH/HpaI aldolase/citrate lyase family protein [Arthrobacter sp. TES]MBN9130234.1 HpcH/HpaI aldolase/citrate lyase family protein [Paenarthrobacter ureafaciens]RWW95247.1 2-dehydro-3-deoxyglucarate aldolase [Paenarthrobacter ureafaciens]
MPLQLSPTFHSALAAADRPLAGMWVCSGSPLVAEICAGSGLDWLLIDAEHCPNGLESILAQLYAASGYPIHVLVRPPVNDTVVIKQYLDLGVQNLLIPMVNSAAEAEAAVAAVRYPPHGVRGVGSALARSARWNRVPDYLATASESISLTVQIESGAAAEVVEEILAVDGVDGIFMGPSDLAASMGLLGQQEHPEVRAVVEHCIKAAQAAGKPAGVNAFNEATARSYLDAGASFVLVGADVAVLARASEGFAAKFVRPLVGSTPASY